MNSRPIFALGEKPIGNRCFGLAVGFVLSLGFPSQARGADGLDEAEGIRLICKAGPERTLANAELERGSARVAAAQVLPNPSVVAEHRQDVSGNSERETIVGLGIPLGLGGRRFLLQDAAAARHRQAAFQAHAMLFEAALAFREAYAAAVIAQARFDVLFEQQQALDSLAIVIQGLANSGEAAGYDLLRHQTQARIHRRLVESARADALGLLATVEAWTGTTARLAKVRLDEIAGGRSLRSKVDSPGVAESSRLRAIDTEASALELEARAARRRWVPDLEIFGGYRQVTLGSVTGHGIALGLNFPLTFFDHGQGEAAIADAERDVARATRASLKRRQQAELKSARARLEVLEASAADVETVIAEAMSVRTKVQQLYAAGEATLTELLDAFRSAEEARLAAVDLAREMATARLDLMRATGSLFDTALDRECDVKVQATQ